LEEEYMEQSLVVVPDAPPPGLFGTGDPKAVIAKASAIATELAAVIEKQGLFVVIGKKKHVEVEGWTLLGSLTGVFPVCVWTRRIAKEDGDGWAAGRFGGVSMHPVRDRLAHPRRLRAEVDGPDAGDLEGAADAARFHHGARRLQRHASRGDGRHGRYGTSRASAFSEAPNAIYRGPAAL
jgi:hypothetical protein